MFAERKGIMMLVVTVFLVTVMAWGIGHLSAGNSKKLKVESVSDMLQHMAKKDGITESEAVKAAIEVHNRLWGVDPQMEISSCELDKKKKLWTVLLWHEHEIDGWGCRVFITSDGHLRKAEVVRGF